MSAYREITSSELRERETRLLKQFAKACRKLGLRYSLAGGTLLGAVRHGGFIPWDDDIDVFMPRPDFDRLWAAVRDGVEDLGLAALPVPDNVSDPVFIKIIDRDVLVQETDAAKPTCLWIDVFPVDGLPDDPDKIEGVYKRAKIWRTIFTLARSTPKASRAWWRHMVKMFGIPLIRVSMLDRFAANRLVILSRAVSFGSTRHIGGVAWGIYGEREALPGDAFECVMQMTFEGLEFDTICDWKRYLTNLYGDFMKLPPEAEQRAHGISAWFVGEVD